MSRQLKGDSVILLVTLCWGLTFPLIENAVSQVAPWVFVTLRFLLGAVILLPFLGQYIKQNIADQIRGNGYELRAGIVLGCLNTITYGTQTIGMQSVTSAQGAFISGISVVLVPFMLPLFRLGFPRKFDVLCALLSLTGLYLLTGASLSHVKTGELWVLVCAFSIALTIVYLHRATRKTHALEALAFYQILFTGLLSACLTWGESYQEVLAWHPVIGILFCAVFATSLALVLQTKYQRYTTASRAALIFCFEPVFGSLFGYIINDEKLGVMAFAGGSLIILSIIISEFQAKLTSKRAQNANVSSKSGVA